MLLPHFGFQIPARSQWLGERIFPGIYNAGND